MSKRGRKALPNNMKARTTSIRLRPDRLDMFKQLGGIKWLNVVIDTLIFEKNFNDGLNIGKTNELGKENELSHRVSFE
jgi:hypothetical protein